MEQLQTTLTADENAETTAAAVSVVRLLMRQEDYHELVREIVRELRADSAEVSEALLEKCGRALARQDELKRIVDETAAEVLRRVM